MDRDGSGSLSVDELYAGLRGEMNRSRLKLVRRCFDFLVNKYKRQAWAGSSRSGGANRGGPLSPPPDAVSVAFLVETFNCDHFPDVQSGKKRFDDERDAFFQQLDGDLIAPKDGFITREKFTDFYQDISGFYVGTVRQQRVRGINE